MNEPESALQKARRRRRIILSRNGAHDDHADIGLVDTRALDRLASGHLGKVGHVLAFSDIMSLAHAGTLLDPFIACFHDLRKVIICHNTAGYAAARRKNLDSGHMILLSSLETVCNRL